jgi:hypothetical protein
MPRKKLSVAWMVWCCGRRDVGICWGWFLTQSYSVTLYGKLLVTMVCMQSSILWWGIYKKCFLQIFWMLHLESFYYSPQSANQDQKKSEQLAHIHGCKVLTAFLPRTYPPTPTKKKTTQVIWTHALGRFCLLLCLYLHNLLTYLLTPWSRVLLEKLTSSQLAKKFPPFYWTRKFITAFTSACHLSLSWTWSIQSIPHNPLPENPA